VAGDLFDGYETEGFFDEVFDSLGEPRPHYEGLVRRLARFSAEDLARRGRRRDAAFRSQGITFTVYSEGEGIERTFPMDLLPRVITAGEWSHIEAGLEQRVTALNRFLDDLYVGERAAVRDGVIPWWVITSSDGFSREAFGVPVPLGARCLVAGIDLVRDAEGTYRVLEDNLRSPTRLLPQMFTGTPVRPVDHYGRSLLGALTRVAPPSSGDTPTVVVLTPGVFNSAYFEHVFLAAHMGVELVEGRDLVVDDHVVYMRTTQGLKRVDVIYRRTDDTFLDPVVFRRDSSLGVPGTVTLVNSVGNGVADDKAVYAYVPELIRYYMGEEPILPNVDTFLLWDPEQRDHVLGRLHELVIKPVAEAGGYGITIGPAASEEELAGCRQAILSEPRNWIAQEVVSLSRHPTLVDDHVEGRHIDLRPFVLTSDTVEVIPGGLTRVAMRKGSLVVNSSQGGGSKDTWVLAPTREALEADAADASKGGSETADRASDDADSMEVVV
jgi:uncharacterized circularly permuted ATP-grasp superfamily protein